MIRRISIGLSRSIYRGDCNGGLRPPLLSCYSSTTHSDGISGVVVSDILGSGICPDDLWIVFDSDKAWVS